jgi:hypothetical protein
MVTEEINTKVQAELMFQVKRHLFLQTMEETNVLLLDVPSSAVIDQKFTNQIK